MEPPSSAEARDPNVSPSPLPPPHPPPAKKKSSSSAWVLPPLPPRPKKTQRKEKDKPAPEKLACEMTLEELTAHGQKKVDDHFRPKKLEPKEPVDTAGKKFFLDIMCEPRKKECLSNYDRSITKSYEKKGNRRYNQVPQLGEQPNQTIPPLKVLSKEDEATTQFVEETRLTKG